MRRSPELRHNVAIERHDAGDGAVLGVQWNHVLAAGAGASTSDDDSGCGIEEFAWVPAGLTPAQVNNNTSVVILHGAGARAQFIYTRDSEISNGTGSDCFFLFKIK